MTHYARRVVLQAIPLAVLILGIGLARQYAAGAGLFESGNLLVAKAQSIFAELRAELAPAAEVEAEPAPTQDDAIANAPAELPAGPTFQPQRFPVQQFRSSCGPSGHCRH